MTEVSKNLMCVVMRNGIHLWIEQERVNALQGLLSKSAGHRFVDFDGETINTADIVGIFTAATMADLTRRNRGEWKCRHGEWHGKNDTCECWRDKKHKSIEERYPDLHPSKPYTMGASQDNDMAVR